MKRIRDLEESFLSGKSVSYNLLFEGLGSLQKMKWEESKIKKIVFSKPSRALVFCTHSCRDCVAHDIYKLQPAKAPLLTDRIHEVSHLGTVGD